MVGGLMPLVLTDADLAELQKLMHADDWRHREAMSLLSWLNKKKQSEAQTRAALAANGQAAAAVQ
jgi:hypothetical protein